MRAEGLEFADTRPFVPGDRVRSVNWRATARRGSLVVNERHPERNADVVIFLDSFAEARASDEGTFEHAVRAAATLITGFLERRDRVGLVAFGGILRWLEPGGGLVQRYRLVDALLETGVEFSYAWKDVNVIPARTLPPGALVIALTPLLDERTGRGARRPSRPRPRPRRARGVARSVRRAVDRSDRRRRDTAVAPPARRAARPLRAARRRRRDARRRDHRRGSARGGEGIPASRPPRAAVAAGAVAVAVALGLAVWLALVASDDAAAPVLALGVTGALLAAAAVVWPVAARPRARDASASAYAVLLAVDEPPLDVRVAGVAACLLVVGELVGWAHELWATTPDEPGGEWRRPTWIAAAGVGALLLVWGLLAIVDLARVEGLAVEAVGAACALAALLVVRRLARRPAAGS